MVTFQKEEVFAFDRSALTPAASARLDRDVVAKLATCARVENVVIEGHADRIGSQQYNQKLSERRSDSVKNYLVSKGADVTVVARSGQTTADMANGPVQRVSPFPATVALLEKLGSKNNQRCVSC